MLKFVFGLRLFALLVLAGGVGVVAVTLGRLELSEAYATSPVLRPVRSGPQASKTAAASPPAASGDMQALASGLRDAASRTALTSSPPAAQSSVAPAASSAAVSEPTTPTRTAALIAPEPQAVAGSFVDLNTASLAELNGLRGGGAIGRAIVRGRPYRSAEELVSRRVLSRARFERIRDQVRVRS
ncbi:hypothetical protein M446_2839 [Methylobacterium sp. 4-46]|uniref:ComEA family DNA-binding protein n=1 Tax=unclassified Methylobacterium TaxID=2615210 RepID=UPI000152D813|nr:MULTISPECIES: helix-hairpin-helix domain-containing protein [Methylobacterium]ACA17264.1 hypothetical protein M446_2839 [Methylobacterium sp. 4-46]WFT82949.1 helix-hairpin-helix domain-containing protein [Methylobacterium nodulans]